MLKEVFEARPNEVFFERQLEVWFEDRFFHWITANALHDLANEKKINTVLMPLGEETNIRFYWSRGLRSWKRQGNEITKLVRRYSAPEFTGPLGLQGELLFDAAMPRVDFQPKGKNVRSYGGKTTKQRGNLDRVFERDGIAYGVEIKNKLNYIGRDELRAKILICRDLGLRPLFICRMLPRNYMWEEIIRAGGFGLIFKWQLYPYGFKDFADEVHQKLGLPTDSPRAIEDGTLQRLVDGHEKIRKGEVPYAVSPRWFDEEEEEVTADDAGYEEFNRDEFE